MKYCIVQLDFYEHRNTKKYSLFKSIFQKSVENYANKNHIDYHLITYEAKYYPSHNEKIKLFKDIVLNYREYEKILYLDLDIFIKDNSPNIFETIECNHLSGCLAIHDRFLFGIQNTRYLLKTNIDNFWKLQNCSLRPNSGVLLFNLKNIPQNIFFSYEEDILEDEMFLSYKIAYRNLYYQIIPSEWNYRNLSLLDNGYFIHVLSNLFDDNGIDATRNFNLETIANKLV